MEILASGLLERVLCTIFSKEAMPSPRLARGGLHMLTWLLMAQLLSLQEPYVVKVAFEEGYQYEFD
jgi:hypothetical protein